MTVELKAPTGASAENTQVVPYAYTPPSRLTRLLWSAAGADPFILQQCPRSDGVRYAGIGGIVLATGVLAGLAGGYAAYTIFGPKGAEVSAFADWSARLVAVVIGVLWGAVIFNLDRYIVSSTGKGDGTDSITRTEFLNALPRMAMGAVLAATIAIPLEIRILKPEIDAEVRRLQSDALLEANASTLRRFAPDTAELQAQLRAVEERVRTSRSRVVALDAAATAELDGTGGSGRASAGPIYQRKLAEAQTARAEDAAVVAAARADEAALRQRLDETLAALRNEYAGNAARIGAMDGLLQRARAAHELSPAFTWMLRLVFLAIELTPIFFELMAVRSTYDYLEENYKEIIKARNGIASSVRLESADGVAHLVEQTVFREARRVRQEWVQRNGVRPGVAPVSAPLEPEGSSAP